MPVKRININKTTAAYQCEGTEHKFEYLKGDKEARKKAKLAAEAQSLGISGPGTSAESMTSAFKKLGISM
jgi:hypothetical protein